MKPEPGAARGPTRPGVRRAAFEQLYARHGREVWAVAYGRRADADLALDVTQETFLRLWREMERGEVIENPRAWLLRVARNLAEDQAKSAFRRNGTQAPEQMNGVGSLEPMPLEKLERDETFAQVRAVIEELPPADREILTLRYALEYDTPAIAELLGVQATAVHMRLSRARQRLADRLKTLGVRSLP